MELPKCEICGVRPVFYQRLRHSDDATLSFDEIRADIYLPRSSELVDVVRHACGGIVWREGTRDFNQLPSSNGFIEYRMDFGWEVHTECPEADRLLRKLRNAQ